MKLVVDSIDTAGGTIVIKSQVDNSSHTYKIDATTRIILVNAKGTIDQIHAGQKVANLVAGPGEPPQTLKLLLVSPAAAAPSAPANP
ncbi:MAG TPA: hypothetical protein VHY09_13895 [Candidatus Methylacidiphilales bacterium]|nr:hypothetical protein [Candidatus Methylacidiphilales bacterium]